MERSVGTPVAKQEYLSQAQSSDMLLILKPKILSGFHFCTYMHTIVEETKEHIRELFFFLYFCQICIHINISLKKLNRCYLTNKMVQDSDAGYTMIFGNTTCIKHITNVQLTIVGCKKTDIKVRGRCSHYLTFYSGPKEDIQLHLAATGKGLQHLSQLG